MKERTYSFFKMNRLILVLLCLFFATNIYAQNREIRGMVTGDDNEPLAGATITTLIPQHYYKIFFLST